MRNLMALILIALFCSLTVFGWLTHQRTRQTVQVVRHLHEMSREIRKAREINEQARGYVFRYALASQPEYLELFEKKKVELVRVIGALGSEPGLPIQARENLGRIPEHQAAIEVKLKEFQQAPNRAIDASMLDTAFELVSVDLETANNWIDSTIDDLADDVERRR